MSTQLRDLGLFIEVSTVVGEGRRKKLPRTSVLIPSSNPQALRDEVVRQATAIRKRLGLKVSPLEPVV